MRSDCPQIKAATRVQASEANMSIHHVTAIRWDEFWDLMNKFDRRLFRSNVEDDARSNRDIPVESGGNS